MTAFFSELGHDAAFHGQHIGPMLLADAITRLAAAPVGIHALCADAIDDAAAAFYREHQFQPFISRPNSFYVSMKTALALTAQAGSKALSAQADLVTLPLIAGSDAHVDIRRGERRCFQVA